MAVKKVLFLAEAVTLAHVARPWKLARALLSSNHRVVFAVDNRYDSLFDFSGMQRESLHSIGSDQFITALSRGSPVYDAETLAGYVEEDLGILGRIQPDLVVGDFRLSLSISARLENIPYLTVSNIYWSPYVQQSYPVPDLQLTRVLGVKLAQLVFNLVRPLAFGLHTLPLNRTRRKFGLKSIGWDLRRIYTDADQVIYADPQDLACYPPLPKNHRFIGPILWSADTAMPEWWERVSNNRPVIFVTLGSSGKKALLPGLITALESIDATVVVAAAGAPLPVPLPENTLAADFLPAGEIIKRSALLISNGGSPTTQLALVSGVPSIGIASNLDQFLNMSGIQRSGVGRLLRADRFDEAELRAVVEEILVDEKMRDRAIRLQEKISKHDAGAAFSSLIDQLI